MALALLHLEEYRSTLPALDGMTVHVEENAATMAALQNRSEEEIQRRFDMGNRAYVATMNGQPAAWGWVATTAAAIGELKTSFSLPIDERYLWNFVTVPAFRGQGIYPRLLDAIIRAESVGSERFWIAYAPENHASAAGIRKAGFQVIAELSFDRAGAPVVKELLVGGAARASRLLGLPEAQGDVAQCWKCVRSGAASCASGSCSCDYQRLEQAC